MMLPATAPIAAPFCAGVIDAHAESASAASRAALSCRERCMALPAGGRLRCAIGASALRLVLELLAAALDVLAEPLHGVAAGGERKARGERERDESTDHVRLL